MSSIYMYHAVGDQQQIAGSDPYYAVTEEVFVEHISSINESIPLAEQIAEAGKISHHCITFDDGHLSNYTVAFPALRKLNLKAEFYINTAFVGDDNYMSWAQLLEMHKAGMSIQSHSHHHYYMSDLSETDVRHELETSKRLIEQNLNSRVTVFAPPGGRINAKVIEIAQSLGYQCIATSEPGVVTKPSRISGVPRFAVLASTSHQRIVAWKSRWSYHTLRERARFNVFGVLKKLLGNGIYDKLRAAVLGEKTVQ